MKQHLQDHLGPPVQWRPDPETAPASMLTQFSGWLREHRGLELTEYRALYDWSVRDLAGFWGAVAEFFDVAFHAPPGHILSGTAMPGMEWFVEAKLNYAEHALRTEPGKTDNDLAVIALDESGEVERLSYGQLRGRVAAVRQGLLDLGVGHGDRIVAFAPNRAEVLIAFLATASIGAVWSSCSPEFGPRAVRDRFAQLEPRVLIAVNSYRYGGRDIDVGPIVAALRRELPSLRATVLIGGDQTDSDPGLIRWSELEELGRKAGPPILSFAPVDFSHPLWVLYSSGTTGLPKGIVHGHGGMLLEHLKAVGLQADLGPGQRFAWYTTTGWMMWNFLVAGLLVGCTIVLYDGSPVYPVPGALWQLAVDAKLDYLGTSAAYLQACEKRRLRPADELDLSRLRAVGSTGSPLPPHTFDWVSDAVGRHVQVCSISGGTDVCTAFLGAAPTVPVWRGELSCRALGAAAAAVDATGTPVVDQMGELVLTAPMPCMPVALWGDVDGSRMRETYFARYPGMWAHGDWVRVTPRGSCVVYGRSDATLNRGGVRMGTAEFYRVIEAFDEVVDSLVIDTSSSASADDVSPAGELLCFVVLAPDSLLDELVPALRRALRAQLSPRHVADRFIAVDEIPVTLSGKKCEIPVKRILTGTPVSEAVSRASLKNPEALEALCERALRPVS
ncbi:MAG TPA: acetoacetate--CoA ligase [Mycobacteriales bacterium]|jgi:acetoacetyl-CoA synthetase|nr:acetoacetate--CoA ligase [Mycobacteriales bacterium]